ncbi:conserved hypothetical protein [Sulfobacillus acidophilus TPY]|uniref:Probable cell division protein WhiA n=1 Tax=Sulfobacillus acidophilus (strain ATCC 700253 / DSM 10332 / NAL) TaxID=679936 RepID=G8TYI9_SULAD|nr:conserved hypothetical protein [Sulfobacillus acidophilus TPY]AEW06250.1 Sporulation regulator WhiA [Sulfobacillus acidophilus DSM 10332]
MAWSYSRQVKTELVHQPLAAIPWIWTELWGLAGTTRMPEAGSRWIVTGSALVARRAYRLLKQVDFHPAVRVRPEGHRLRFELWVGDGSPPDWDTYLADCAPAYIRGAFLARGYVADHERPAHWEVTATEKEAAEGLLWALAQEKVAARMTERRRLTVIYLKDRQQIARVLGIMGAHQAMLTLESQDVVRQMKNQVNRLVNSETANLKRAINAGLNDRERLEEWRVSRGFAQLPADLMPLAELRWRHPEWTLAELGRHLSPPVSKSVVNHRLRRLRQWLGHQQ